MSDDYDIALRCYSRKHDEKSYQSKNRNPWVMPERVFVFDTETIADERLSLTFGSCKVYHDDQLEHVIMFYSDLVKDHEMNFLRQYANKKGYNLIYIDEFRDIFLLLAYEMESLIVGFNLPFDLTRIAIDTVPGRGRNNGAFSVILSESPEYPRLIIRHVDNTKSFIHFSNSYDRKKGTNKWIKKYQKTFRGNFTDLRTAVYSLTNEKMSLAKSCDHFNTGDRKKDVEEHGKITPEYIEYNEADVDATYSLYLAVMKEFERYNLDLPISKLFSPASIGKAYLKMMGIKSLKEKNPDFPDEVLGYLMTTFYGGRSEVRIRKKPVEIAYMDVLSMYPTVNILMGLWQYVVSDHIDHFDDTESVREFVHEVDLESLNKKETWRSLNAICLVKPKGEIFPVRSKYGDKHVFNIGLNNLTSDTPIWYTLADVISAKLLSGREPEIIRAIRFEPNGIQEGLRKIDIIGNIHIDPERDDLFRILIEKRNGIKERKRKFENGNFRNTFPKSKFEKGSGSNFENGKYSEMNSVSSEIPKSEIEKLESEQYILKTITNSTSYGIFVQLDSQRIIEQTKFDVHGLNEFQVSKRKAERFGQMFNPILGTFITSASRLILAISERILMDHGETYAFCDTDSMAVPVHCAHLIQDYFKHLNPYSFPSDIFEMEDENYNPDTHAIEPLWFYGISAKRYVLYNIRDGNRIILKKSLHGLGHIRNPFHTEINWQEKIWQDILECHYHPERLPEILDEYKSRYAVSQLTISTPDILRRFDDINKDLPYDCRIKPFNFSCVGTSVKVNDKTGDPIKPIVPYTSTYHKVPFGPFMDYHSGDKLQGTEYWQSMDNVLYDYMNHPESKFKGDVGILSRRDVNVREIIYIGKESDKLDESSVMGVGKDGYPIYNGRKWKREQIRNDPYSVTYREAEEMGISRSSLKRWRKQ